MAESFENQRKKFEQKYGVEVSFEKMETMFNKLRYLDSFLFSKTRSDSPSAKYRRGLMYLLHSHIEKKTKMEQGSEYDLTRLNIVDFVREYEDMVAQRHAESEKSATPRAPREGMKEGKLLDYISKNLKQYDKSLSDIWADRVVNGAMSYKEMKTITTAENTAVSQNKEDAPQNSLANIVIAKEAMEKVCRQRGVFWIAFHPVQYYKEKSYLNELIGQVDRYRVSMRNDVSYALEKTSGMMDGAYRGINKLKSQEEKKLEIEQLAKEDPESDYIVVPPVTDKIKEIMAQPDFAKNFVKEILDKFPEKSIDRAASEDMMMGFFNFGTFQSNIEGLNAQFDKAMNKGKDAKEEMAKMQEKIFIHATPLVPVGITKEEEFLAARQVIADIITKKLTPVAFEPKLKEFEEGYVLNHPKSFQTEEYERAKPVYNDMKRVRVSIIEANHNDNNVKAAPIQEAPVVKGPDLNKNV